MSWTALWYDYEYLLVLMEHGGSVQHGGLGSVTSLIRVRATPSRLWGSVRDNKRSPEHNCASWRSRLGCT